jgi:hypothetical protein
VCQNVLRWNYRLDDADLLLQELEKDPAKHTEFVVVRQSWIDWRNDRSGNTGKSGQAGIASKRRRIRRFAPGAEKDETDDDEPDLPSTVGHRRENVIRVTESLGNLWPTALYTKKFRRVPK